MNAADRPVGDRRTRTQLFLICSSLQLLAALILGQLMQTTRVSGGICWASMDRNGRCKELTAERVTREECCSASQPPAAAWSSEDLDTGALFFWKLLGGGVPCSGCRETCAGVQCGEGRRCAVRRGRPRCVCAPKCGGGGSKPGPVCGTDGRSYRSLCRLRKRACRRRARELAVDYYGHCQSSCARIRCGGGRHCVVDQDSRAHCVRCARTCPARSSSSAVFSEGSSQQHEALKPLCGVDGVTYPTACHLRAAACRAGRSIPLAYRGACNPGASCGSVRCRERQACLSDPLSGSPRCVTCGARCPRSKRALCASNNRTYASWCHMLRDACATGFIIETRHAGHCSAGNLDDTNTVLHDSDHDDDEGDNSS